MRSNPNDRTTSIQSDLTLHRKLVTLLVAGPVGLRDSSGSSSIQLSRCLGYRTTPHHSEHTTNVDN